MDNRTMPTRDLVNIVLGEGVSTTHVDPRIQAGLFPIRSDEAAVLHDMGWSSGFGWSDEWDWWIGNDSGGAGSRSMQIALIEDLTVIRVARYRADEICRRALRGDEQSMQAGSSGPADLTKEKDDEH